MLHAAQTMIKQEGPASLWNGATPALLRQVSYTSICMVLYEPLRNFFGANAAQGANGEVPFINKFLAGGCAGAIGISIANPVDVIKVRMQADRSGKLYRGVGDAFTMIYQREGLRGFLRGMPPNIQRGFIVNAAELGTYDHSKELLISSGLLKEGVLAHTGASCVAGFAGAAASNPIDVVKTRLMSQPTDVSGKGLHYKGMMDCVRKTFHEGGFAAFYKGFIPNWMRKAPWNSDALHGKRKDIIFVITIVYIERLMLGMTGRGAHRPTLACLNKGTRHQARLLPLELLEVVHLHVPRRTRRREVVQCRNPRRHALDQLLAQINVLVRLHDFDLLVVRRDGHLAAIGQHHDGEPLDHAVLGGPAVARDHVNVEAGKRAVHEPVRDGALHRLHGGLLLLFLFRAVVGWARTSTARGGVGALGEERTAEAVALLSAALQNLLAVLAGHALLAGAVVHRRHLVVAAPAQEAAVAADTAAVGAIERLQQLLQRQERLVHLLVLSGEARVVVLG
ncbi:hypothetical protein ON010_g10700 [Phytophthora cinnamomi]|nr:hypothetical protein ON010_g10700 [Phytophthora cinnamomi]